MTQEELAVNAQNGDLEALSLLWEEVKNLLFSMAWKFYLRQGKERCAQRGVTLEDLQQETFLALADAARDYRTEKGIRFTTTLTWASENRFRACMGRRGKPDPLNDSASMDEPAKPAPEEAGDSLGDFIPDPKAAQALERVEALEACSWVRAVLEKVLGELSPIQEAVLRRRFYLRQTRTQTAQALHITPAQVQREEAKALRTLRGKPTLCQRKEEALEAAAYQGTGWYSWYYGQASVEERLAESRLFEA